MSADVLILVMLAIGDLCLIVDLRRRRARYMRMDRMNRCLQLHIKSELSTQRVGTPLKRRVVRIS